MGFRAGWLPFPHLLDTVGHEAEMSCIRGATFPPFVQNFLLEHCGPDVLLSSWALTSRQAGGAIEYDSKISTVFVGIIFGTRVKEVMSSPFIQNVLLEFGETSHYFCSKVASQG